MRLFAVFVALLGAFFSSLRAEDFQARTFSAPDGRSIPYRLMPPQDYDASKKYPLVLFLHGAGERGSDNEKQLKHGAQTFAKPAIRSKYPCFVVAPQVPDGQKWVDMDWGAENGIQPASPTGSMELAIAAVEALQKEFSVDPDRLYVTGLSMGGFGTWDALTRWPGKWAAAVPVCGGGDPAKAGSAAALPIWAFHGGADGVVKTNRTRQMISSLKAAKSTPLYSEYPNVGHDSWSLAFQEPELLPWLFAQKRGQAVVPFEKIAPNAPPPSDAFPSEGPVQIGAWFHDLWINRRSSAALSVAADQGSIVFFGDSITQGWGTLATDFPGVKLANRGIAGDTTRGLLYRVKADVLDLHPKAVSLLIGTNDLSLGAKPALVLKNIQLIVAALHQADPVMPVILNKVMPRGPKAGLFPEKIQELNALLEDAFKSDKRVTFCDTWALFEGGAGACKKEEFPDMLHPNALGYAKWTAALKPILTQLKLASF